MDVSACNKGVRAIPPGIHSSKNEGRASMKVRFIRALVSALSLSAAWAAQAQGTPTWYVGAAGGGSHVSLACEPALACDRSGAAWKIYGGLQWGNHTGAELVYEDFGRASAAAIDALDVTAATVRPRALGLAAVWQPDLAGGLSAKFKVGVSSAKARLQGDSNGAAVDEDRKTFAHWWLAAGLAWRVAPHWEIAADFDWTRAGYRNESHKQTSDVGAFTVGAAWHF
jgi:hypothetical protein